MHIRTAEFVKGIKGSDDILHDGVPAIAFVGRSNVGKSSIINLLTGGRDLVKVGKMPGKTKEINYFLINKKFYFVDLPGYGYANTGPKGKEKNMKLILWYLTGGEARPVCFVLIIDVKAGITDFDREVLEIFKEEGHQFLLVVNKTDKLKGKELGQQIARIKRDSCVEDPILFSVTKRIGKEILLQRISNETHIAKGVETKRRSSS